MIGIQTQIHRLGTRGVGTELNTGHALQGVGHVLQGHHRANTQILQLIANGDHLLATALCQGSDQIENVLLPHITQHGSNLGLNQGTTAKSNGLIGQRQCISHGAFGGSRNQRQRCGLKAQLLLGEYMG